VLLSPPLGDVMWEPLVSCKELAALDEYLELHGVKQPPNLPRKNVVVT
jgi:hypothetical protein